MLAARTDAAHNDAAKNLRRAVHSALQQAEFDYQRLQYNTVVSAAMKMLNALEEAKAAPGIDRALHECVSILIRVLYPIAPHVTTQLWSDLGYEKAHGPLLDAPWPKADLTALEQSEITLVVQVNGKLRGEIVVPKDAAKDAIESAALANENVSKFTQGLSIKKVVIVPGKLVNVVVA
jgi:leucyl-tRNA synthetase